MTQERLYEINAKVTEYYVKNLTERKSELAYLSLLKAGLTDRTIGKFDIGYSSRSVRDLIDYAAAHDISISELCEAGLLINQGEQLRLVFDDRVMIPIRDENGNVVSFCGRMIEKGPEVQYLFLPFAKNSLFAINVAKNTQEDHLILCEEFLDTLLLYERGKNNAVGYFSNFGEAQARAIGRYTRQVKICADRDSFDKELAEKVCSELIKVGVKARIESI